MPRNDVSGSERATAIARRSGQRRAAAAATVGVIVGLVACDVWVAGVRVWWDRHSFTTCVVSSLLVLGVAVLIIDEVLARRQREQRAVSVAVQAVIVYGQASRSCDAVVAVAVGNDGAKGTGVGVELDVDQVNVREEVRNLASMILVASPALFDDPEARLFLEEVQRLSATMYSVLARHKLSPAPGTADGDGTAARLSSGRSKMDARVRPLAARLTVIDTVPLDVLADLTAPTPEPSTADAREE